MEEVATDLGRDTRTTTTQALPAFAAALFISAFLLFAVQPLMGKYILPWFGGSPGVWTLCMLFFQVLLLAGYAYAHLSTRCFSPRAQMMIHIALLVAAATMLPITPAERWKPLAGANPSWQILLLLTACLGLPYFVLSATGPLLQAWYSRLNSGAAPYRLYALSNLRSLMALMAYPFLIEPSLSRVAQARLWSAGLGGFVILCAYCALRSFRNPTQAIPDEARGTGAPPVEPAAIAANTWAGRPCHEVARPTRARQLLWLALPMVASVLLLATTNKMCQDVAVVPFLWVLPLGLYLLSFILCFDSPRWYWRPVFGPWLILAIAGVCWIQLREGLPIARQVGIYSAALFICCMVCHGELNRLRPSPRYLTSFYLMIALGGALGGIFVALVAPLIFSDYFELQGGLLACGVLALIVYWTDPKSPLHRGRPFWAWGPLIALLPVLGGALWQQANAERDAAQRIGRWRNFYGVLSVSDHGRAGAEDRERRLYHGRIIHGMQFLDPARRSLATTYYSPDGGVGLTMRLFPRQENRRIGLVGLGAGTLAAYGHGGDYLRFYEINPQVTQLARSQFTYLRDCPATIDIIPGDARLSMEREEAQDLDILVLDAFSGDAIPVHLLTRECFQIYLRHCKPDAVIAVHISNRHLDLEPVVAKLAECFQLQAAVVDTHDEQEAEDATDGRYGSTWVLLTNNQGFLNQQELQQSSRPPGTTRPGLRLWTDDDTNLFQILK